MRGRQKEPAPHISLPRGAEERCGSHCAWPAGVGASVDRALRLTRGCTRFLEGQPLLATPLDFCQAAKSEFSCCNAGVLTAGSDF